MASSILGPLGTPTRAVTTLVYHSLPEVQKVLASLESVSTTVPELGAFLQFCNSKGLLDADGGGDDKASTTVATRRNGSLPFIVIEGLDGNGKTTLTSHLSQAVPMKLLSTPPKVPQVMEARSYFDKQSESIRRAFYSMGNYLAVQDVLACDQPVVMDRFWHSTAAYALAHLVHEDPTWLDADEEAMYKWPEDLLKPDLVIFLTVSEKERLRRHANRRDFTNTQEEQMLAKDALFRQNLTEIYRKISGPTFLELNVDGKKDDVKARVLKAVTDAFPSLLERP